MLRAFPLRTLIALLASTVAAQKPAPSPSPRAPSGVGTVPSQSSPNPLDQYPDAQTPVMLFGTVVIEGGGGPASNVEIKRFCGNIPRTVARTNPRGQFSFQWNDLGDVLPDASDPGTLNANQIRSGPAANFPSSGTGSQNGTRGPGRMNPNDLPGVSMTGCDLEADAPGFRSDRIELTGHRALDNPDIGMIVLHRLSSAEGHTVSVTTLGVPKEARRAWEKGTQLLRAAPPQDPAGAEREFERAVRIYPAYAQAWFDLGRTRIFELKEDRAREAFQKAVDVDDRMVEALIGLGLISSRRREWSDAARYLDRALQLNPVDYPHLWYDDAEADYQVRNLDRAERNVRRALKMVPGEREPRAVRLLGLVLMSKQDYAGAEAALREYLESAPDIEDFDELMANLEEVRLHLHPKP